MPKIVINRTNNPKDAKLITERTSEINSKLKEVAKGDLISISEITQYLKCSPRSVSRYLGHRDKPQLPPVNKACGTRNYRTIDAARRFAELEVLR